MNIIIYFFILETLQNIYMAECNHSGTENESESIDVDLKNIDDKNFKIVKSIIDIDPNYQNKIEAYRLEPRANKKINKISFNKFDIWDSNDSSECLSITIYNYKYIFFVIKVSKHGIDGYFHVTCKKGRFGAISLLDFLYDINHESVEKRGFKSQTLNVSNDFDKLYYKHLYRQRLGYRYETFEPNKGEKFSRITDNSDTIWESFIWNDTEVRCVKVLVFKRIEIIINKRTGKARRAMFYRFLSLVFDNDTVKYLKIDDDVNQWVEVTPLDFTNGTELFRSRGLSPFKEGETSFSDVDPDPNDLNKEGKLDLTLFMRSKVINYVRTSILNFRSINLTLRGLYGINRILYYDLVIVDMKSQPFLLNISTTGGGWYYLEFIIVDTSGFGHYLRDQGLIAEKVGTNLYYLYFRIIDDTNEIVNISRETFYDTIGTEVEEAEQPSDLKYSNFRDLQGGTDTSEVSDEVKLKINPRYVRSPHPDVSPSSNTIPPSKPDGDPVAPPIPSVTDSTPKPDQTTGNPPIHIPYPQPSVNNKVPTTSDKNEPSPQDKALTTPGPLTTEAVVNPPHASGDPEPSHIKTPGNPNTKNDMDIPDPLVNLKTHMTKKTDTGSADDAGDKMKPKNKNSPEPPTDLHNPEELTQAVLILSKVRKYANLIGRIPIIGNKKSGYISSVTSTGILIILCSVLI